MIVCQTNLQKINIYQQVKMEYNQSQSMQNWKRQIIMDPLLNNLFDNTFSPQTLLSTKILCLQQDQIIKTYAKMASLKHSITKNMQKEVEIKHPKIEDSFYQNYQIKKTFQSINTQKLANNLKQIKRFNEKYENIESNIIELKNIYQILHFSKALQKFKVNIKVLKTLMKDFDQRNQSSIELLNFNKISKKIKELISLTIKFDFSGISSFQSDRSFINESKIILFNLIEKQIHQKISDTVDQFNNLSKIALDQSKRQIKNKINMLNNLGKLKDFLLILYKNTLKELGEKVLKKWFSQPFEETEYHDGVVEEYYYRHLRKKILSNTILMVILQQILTQSNLKLSALPNLVQKFVDNIIEFIDNLIKWNVQNQSREKNTQTLMYYFQADNVNYSQKYFLKMVWKYPSYFYCVSQMCSQMHFCFLKITEYNYYDFSKYTQKMMKCFVPFSNFYWQNIKRVHKNYLESLQKNFLSVIDEKNNVKDVDKQFFWEVQEKSKSYSLKTFCKSFQWIIKTVKTEQIYAELVERYLLNVGQQLKRMTQIIISKSSSPQNRTNFITRMQKGINELKAVILKGEIQGENQIDGTQKSLNSSPDKLMKICLKLRQIEKFMKKALQKI